MLYQESQDDQQFQGWRQENHNAQGNILTTLSRNLDTYTRQFKKQTISSHRNIATIDTTSNVRNPVNISQRTISNKNLSLPKLKNIKKMERTNENNQPDKQQKQAKDMQRNSKKQFLHTMRKKNNQNQNIKRQPKKFLEVKTKVFDPFTNLLFSKREQYKELFRDRSKNLKKITRL